MLPSADEILLLAMLISQCGKDKIILLRDSSFTALGNHYLRAAYYCTEFSDDGSIPLLHNACVSESFAAISLH